LPLAGSFCPLGAKSSRPKNWSHRIACDQCGATPKSSRSISN